MASYNAQQIKDKAVSIAVICSIIATVTPFAGDIYVPSLPAITDYFFTSDSLVTLTITVSMLGVTLAALVYGPLSDRFGRRSMLINGLVIAFIGTLICALAPSIEWLLIGRFIQGVGLGSTTLFRAIMRDVFTAKQLAQVGSIVTTLYALAPAIAPVIGGFTEEIWGWRASFWIVLGYLTLSLLLAWYTLPETHLDTDADAAKPGLVLRAYGQLLRNRFFMGHVIVSSLSVGGIFAYATMSSFLLQDQLGLSAAQFGLVAGGITFGMIVGKLLNALLLRWLSIAQMLIIGILAMLLGGVLMLAWELIAGLTMLGIVIPVACFIVGTGSTLPNAMAGALNPLGKMAGTAGALYGSLQIGGGVLVTAIVAGIHGNTAAPLAWIFITLSLVSLCAYGWLALLNNNIAHEPPVQ